MKTKFFRIKDDKTTRPLFLLGPFKEIKDGLLWWRGACVRGSDPGKTGSHF